MTLALILAAATLASANDNIPLLTIADLKAPTTQPIEAPSNASQQQGLVLLVAKAIERGVPLYNDGNREACAGIYETTIDAIMISDVWGMGADERLSVQRNYQAAMQMDSVIDRAWAYRSILDSILTTRLDTLELVQNQSISGENQILFSFDSDAERLPWRVVLDGVMGGLSTGQVDVENGSMVFSGETSLRNNGGFSSIRASLAEGTLRGYDSIELKVRGDGRTYILGTSTRGRMGGESYWHRFDTTDGEWTTVQIPIAAMERHYYGQKLPGRIKPEEVRGLELYIYDKKAGPFSIEIDSIEGRPAPSLLAQRAK